MPMSPCSPPRSPGTATDNANQINDFLAMKLQENEELVEYVSYLEKENEKAESDRARCADLEQDISSLQSRLKTAENEVRQWKEHSARHRQSEEPSEVLQLKKEVEEMRHAMEAARHEMEEMRLREEESADILQAARTEAEQWQHATEAAQQELLEMTKKAEKWRHAAEAESEATVALRQEMERSSSREEELSQQEISSLRKAVQDLRGEVQRQQEELRSGKSPDEIMKITVERDNLRQVVAKQRQHLQDLSKAHRPGLPPLPPGSPPAAPAHPRCEARDEDSCSTDWGEQVRSEAPSRTSGANTPSLPEGRNTSCGHSESPAMYACSEPASHSEGRSLGRQGSGSSRTTSGSIHISEQSSDPPALSISPTPTYSFIPVDPTSRLQRSVSLSPRPGMGRGALSTTSATSPNISASGNPPSLPPTLYPHQTSVDRPNSYASLSRANKQRQAHNHVQQGYSAQQVQQQNSRARNTSPATSRTRQPTRTHTPSHKHPAVRKGKDRSYAPLVFCIDP